MFLEMEAIEKKGKKGSKEARRKGPKRESVQNRRNAGRKEKRKARKEGRTERRTEGKQGRKEERGRKGTNYIDPKLDQIRSVLLLLELAFRYLNNLLFHVHIETQTDIMENPRFQLQQPFTWSLQMPWKLLVGSTSLILFDPFT